MNPFARATAMRWTALSASLALAVGLSAFAADACAKAKVPLPKAAADRAQRRSENHRRRQAVGYARFVQCGNSRSRNSARHPPACGAATPPARKPTAAGGDGRDLIDVASRYRRGGKRHRTRAQPQTGGCDAGRGVDIRSGRAKARRMDHPAQRQQWRVGRALSRLHRRQSELAVADIPAPASGSRPLGRPSRRRHGDGVVRKRETAIGQRQILSGESTDRARRSGRRGTSDPRRVAVRTRCRRTPKKPRWICSARC